jgi:hypothetical protein
MAGRPESIQGVLNQSLVSIVVGGNAIQVYPQRNGDTVIYHVWDPGQASPVKPREVRWVVDGLGPGQTLRI